MSNHTAPTIPNIVPAPFDGKLDVRIERHQTGIVIGWDLVLWIGTEDTDEEQLGGQKRRFEIGVCDSDANHLATLAVCPTYPPDIIIATAIQTAKDAFPTHVAEEDQRTGEVIWEPQEEPGTIARHTFTRDRSKAGFVCTCGELANTPIHGR